MSLTAKTPAAEARSSHAQPGERRRRVGSGGGLDSKSHADHRNPRAFPLVLRGAGASADALGLARAVGLRPVRVAHHGRDAAVQALLHWGGGAALEAPDELPEVLPDHGYRERGLDAPAPHVLRDARQLLDRRLLQAGSGRVRARPVHEWI